MTGNYLTLLAGIVCAGIGGELFLRGLVGIAQWARVSAAIAAALHRAPSCPAARKSLIRAGVIRRLGQEVRRQI